MLTDKQKIALMDAMGQKLLRYVPTKLMASVMGLESMSSVARRVGSSIWLFRYYIDSGRIPRPSVQMGRREFYSAEVASEIVRKWADGSYRSSLWATDKIAEIKALYATGLTQWEIAEKYNCTQSTISRLLRGRKYSRAD